MADPTTPETVEALSQKCADLAAYEEWKVGVVLAGSQEPWGIFREVSDTLRALSAALAAYREGEDGGEALPRPIERGLGGLSSEEVVRRDRDEWDERLAGLTREAGDRDETEAGRDALRARLALADRLAEAVEAYEDSDTYVETQDACERMRAALAAYREAGEGKPRATEPAPEAERIADSAIEHVRERIRQGIRTAPDRFRVKPEAGEGRG